jgi:hypothetical protein
MARAMPARNWSGVPLALRKALFDQLNVNPAVLRRLDRVGDLHQLARRGVGINEGAGLYEFRHAAILSSLSATRVDYLQRVIRSGRCSAFASSQGARSLVPGPSFVYP